VLNYNIMTARMAHGVAADVALLVNLEESYPPGKTRTALLDAARLLLQPERLLQVDAVFVHQPPRPVEYPDDPGHDPVGER